VCKCWRNQSNVAYRPYHFDGHLFPPALRDGEDSIRMQSQNVALSRSGLNPTDEDLSVGTPGLGYSLRPLWGRVRRGVQDRAQA